MIELIRALHGGPRRAPRRARHGRGVRARRPPHRDGGRRGDRARGAPDEVRRAPGRARRLSRRGGPRHEPRSPRERLCTAFYGASHVLHGVDFTLRRGETIAPHGPQRHGQDDAAALAASASSPTGAAACSLNGRDVTRRRPRRSRAAASPRAGGARHLRLALGRREPRHGGAPGRSTARATGRSTASSRLFPRLPSAAATAATSSPAASSRCSTIGRALMTNPDADPDRRGDGRASRR